MSIRGRSTWVWLFLFLHLALVITQELRPLFKVIEDLEGSGHCEYADVLKLENTYREAFQAVIKAREALDKYVGKKKPQRGQETDDLSPEERRAERREVWQWQNIRTTVRLLFKIRSHEDTGALTDEESGIRLQRVKGVSPLKACQCNLSALSWSPDVLDEWLFNAKEKTQNKWRVYCSPAWITYLQPRSPEAPPSRPPEFPYEPPSLMPPVDGMPQTTIP